MKKKLIAIFILGCAIFLLIWNGYKRPYFVPVQIEGYTHGSLPYIKANIEDREYCFILDLGYSGEVTLAYGGVAEIKGKVFEKSVTKGGFLGNKYKKNAYRLPQFRVNQMRFDSVLLEEESTYFHIDSAFDPSTVDLPELTAGSLGSLLFKKTCVCVDLYSSMMAFCDSFETLKKELKPVHSFTKVPFQFDNGLVEFDLQTSQGVMHCMLDSGSSVNCINTPNPENIPIKELVKEKKQIKKCKIGDYELGSIIFSSLPLKFPIKIDAILGVDFLLEHIVVIDYIHHELYVRKTIYQE